MHATTNTGVEEDRALEDKMQALLSALSAAGGKNDWPGKPQSAAEDDFTAVMKEEMSKWKAAHPEEEQPQVEVVKVKPTKGNGASGGEESLEDLLGTYMDQIKVARDASGKGQAPVSAVLSKGDDEKDVTTKPTAKKDQPTHQQQSMPNYDAMSLSELVAQLDNFNADGTPVDA